MANTKQYIDAWQDLIDQTLHRWLRDPSLLDDEGVDAPSGAILRLALDLAEKFRDEGVPPPDKIVTDPNGGIVFERTLGNETEIYHVWDDGAVEFQRFAGDTLIERSAV